MGETFVEGEIGIHTHTTDITFKNIKLLVPGEGIPVWVRLYEKPIKCSTPCMAVALGPLVEKEAPKPDVAIPDPVTQVAVAAPDPSPWEAIRSDIKGLVRSFRTICTM